jgi:hypothetical protein
MGAADDDTESIVSGLDNGSELNNPPQTPSSRFRQDHHVDTPGSDVFPNDSASVINEEERSSSEIGMRGAHGATSSLGGMAIPPPAVDDGTYLFKFAAPGGTTHRFQARYDSFEFISSIIANKLASDPFFAAPSPASTPVTEGFPTTPADPSKFQLSYLDDDGDWVLITADGDVLDAVNVARKGGKDRVVLHLRGGKEWDDEAERRGLSKSKGGKKEVLKAVSEEEDEEDEEELVVKAREKKSKRGKRESTLIMGFLPADQILAASVGFLAVTIVGVFAISKATSK